MTFNPFLSIWTRPRETVRAIIAENPTRHIYLLAALAGLGEEFHRASNLTPHQDQTPQVYLILLGVLIGLVWGLFTLWFGSVLFRWTGSLFDGRATLQTLRTALAWGSVPNVAGLLLWVPYLLVVGPGELLGRPSPPGVLSVAFGLAQTILGFWGFVVLCNTVAEIQGFRSAWLAFANFLLSMFVVAVPLALILIVVLILNGHR